MCTIKYRETKFPEEILKRVLMNLSEIETLLKTRITEEVFLGIKFYQALKLGKMGDGHLSKKYAITIVFFKSINLIIFPMLEVEFWYPPAREKILIGMSKCCKWKEFPISRECTCRKAFCCGKRQMMKAAMKDYESRAKRINYWTFSVSYERIH